MALLRLPELRDAENVSARELQNLGVTEVDDGEQPLPPSIATVPPTTALPIYDGGDVTVMLAQPAEDTEYWPGSRPWFDAKGQNEIRVIVDVEDAGAEGAGVVALYNPDPEGSPSGWVTPAAYSIPVSCPIHVAGPQRGGWVPLVEAAARDNAWKAVGRGGDGVITPAVGKVHFQFRAAPHQPRERFYWRHVTPGVTPAVVSTAGPVDNFFGCDPEPFSGPYLTPTAGDVQAAPGSLLRAKGNVDRAVVPTSADAHEGAGGPVLRFVSPPLAAQTIREFTAVAMCTAIAPSANTAGHVAAVLYLYRPSTEEVVAYSLASYFPAAWVRFTRRARVLGMPFGPFVGTGLLMRRVDSVEAEAGDRWVLDVSSGVDIACGGLQTTQGMGCWVQYDGTVDSYADGDVIFTPPSGGTASWLEIPRFRYTSEEA